MRGLWFCPAQYSIDQVNLVDHPGLITRSRARRAGVRPGRQSNGRPRPVVVAWWLANSMEDTMPNVTVPEDTFRRLSERAAALNISVDELVKPALDQLAAAGTSSPESLLPL